jgi:hypothetical protein
MKTTRWLFTLCLSCAWTYGVAQAQAASPSAPCLRPALHRNQDQSALAWIGKTIVLADSKGGTYVSQLGSTRPHGEDKVQKKGQPVELFSLSEARSLNLRSSGGGEQSRSLLLNVPYARKAADAETVGGFSPSAFVLAS